jgi:hypothetical protein
MVLRLFHGCSVLVNALVYAANFDRDSNLSQEIVLYKFAVFYT